MRKTNGQMLIIQRLERKGGRMTRRRAVIGIVVVALLVSAATPLVALEWPAPATTLREALHNMKFVADHELYRQEDFYTEATLQRLFGKHEVRIRRSTREEVLLGGMDIPCGVVRFDRVYFTLEVRCADVITVADVEAIFGHGWKAVKPRPFSSHQREWPPPTRPDGNLRMWYLIGRDNAVGSSAPPKFTLIDIQFRQDATLMYVEISEHGALQKGDPS
jgi:hypothetical protein